MEFALAERIVKPPARVRPNLADPAALGAPFDWEAARRALGGIPGGGVNLAWAALERHARGSRREHAALRLVRRDGTRQTLTFGALADSVRRFAAGLRGLGVRRGDPVFLLLPRGAELFVAMLGTLACGAVAAPLFAAFGPEPIRTRLLLGKGRVLVTTAALFERKVRALLGGLPELAFVVVVEEPGQAPPPGTLGFGELLARGGGEFALERLGPEDPALLHFTSGTTGAPKGAVLVHDAGVMQAETARVALDLHPEDVFWCTADPGWVTGTAYGILAPLLLGVTSVVDEGEFEAGRWYRLLAEERVTVWYTAPTAIRLLMKAGGAPARAHDLGALRFVASVGEPLNPEAVLWGRDVLGLPIHDNYWQTETGGIVIANVAALDIKPGSMGKPMPGIEAHLVRRSVDGALEHVTEPGREGELALRAPWPAMFRGYLGQPERTRACFVGDLYLTGDLARRDAEGYFWFVARADDVIKSSGHLIGPFEVESALLEHPAVAEAAVIGKPDPVAGELVKAFVTLKAGVPEDESLQAELLGFARRRLGPAVAPRELAFAATLPRTRSGKLLRRLLRARELGLPEGDLSTLEGPA